MINNAKFLAELGHIEKPPYLQLVLGVLGQIQATVENLLHMVRCIPRDPPGPSVRSGWTSSP